MATLQNELEFARPPADKVLFRKHVQRELDEIRKEVEETCTVAEDVYRVPEAAYEETFSLLEQMPRDIPMPDMMWLEDGGIGLEWRPGDGIATMSIYGDSLVVYGASLGNERRVKGTCSLSDPILLPNFLKALSTAFDDNLATKALDAEVKSALKDFDEPIL